MGAIIKSNKWYGRIWPLERRKVKLMQALYDYQAPEIEEKVKKAWSDHVLYGKPLPEYQVEKVRLEKEYHANNKPSKASEN